MNDITSITDGDLNVIPAQTMKAANVLQVQIGDLEYSQQFGIDLKFFLDPDFQFQNESFKAYLIQRLAEHHVNVTQVLESLEKFFISLTFEVGSSESSGGFIR
jgi:hypothetical protein